MNDEPPKLADVIVELCTKAAPDGTVDPEEIAKTFMKLVPSKNLVTWEGYLLPVRDNAVKLAKEGKIVIYRKGVPADPETFKGVYRLGLPKAS
jgi:hypothetical protein